MNLMKLNIYKITLFLILIFIPVNLLKDLFPFPITLINGGLILVSMFLILLQHMKKNTLILLFIPAAIFIFNFLFTDDYGRHIRYFINWYSMWCTLLICSEQKFIKQFAHAYSEAKHNLFKTAWGITILCIVLLLLPQSYSGGWWGLSNGFTAFTVSHAVAASISTLAAFILLFRSSQKFLNTSFFLLLLCIFMIFQTGARAYVISIGTIFLFYIFNVIKNPKIQTTIIICGIIFTIAIFSKSAFAEKLQIVLSYQTVNNVSFLNAITSGRTTIWLTDITHFLQSNVLTYLLGKGFAYSYFLNRNFYYGMNIFSHNIFLETLLSSGIIGILLLIGILVKIFRALKPNKIEYITLLTYIVFVGFLNGLFDSQIYCYSILIICITLEIVHTQNNRSYLSIKR